MQEKILGEMIADIFRIGNEALQGGDDIRSLSVTFYIRDEATDDRHNKHKE